MSLILIIIIAVVWCGLSATTR